MNVRLFTILLYFLLIVLPGFYLILDRRAAVETTMMVEPPIVQPGQEVKVISLVKVLRSHCRGRVYPELAITNFPIINLPSQHVAIHDVPGDYGPYQYKLKIPPDAPRGVEGVFRRRTDRWCNLLQELLLPIHELHEAHFMVANAPP